MNVDHLKLVRRRADWMDIFRPDQHVLVIGAPKSGKTTFLLYIAEVFRREYGHTVLVRDIGDFFEFLNLCKTAVDEGRQIVALLPEGCDIKWRGKGLEKRFYNPGDLLTIFTQMKKGEVNILFADRFITGVTEKPKVQMRFWTSFFRSLLAWKNQPGFGSLPLDFVFDQFNDIGCGKGNYTMPGQEHLVKGIASNLKDFRRANIKLIASTHTYDNIAKVFRQIECHVIKRNYSSEGAVPDVLKPFVHMLPKIRVDRCWFIDQNRALQGPEKDPLNPEEDSSLDTPMFVRPEQYYNVTCEGSINSFFVRVKRKKWVPSEIVQVVEGKAPYEPGVTLSPEDFKNRAGLIDARLIVAKFDCPNSKAYAVKAQVEKDLGLELSEKDDLDWKG